MKSRLTIAVLFILLSCRASAQEWVEGGLYAEHYQLGYRSQQQIGGILHVGLLERFTVNWQIGLGPAGDGGYYFHAPAGLVAGYVLMRNQQNRPIINALPLFNNLGALLFLCPEGVGYYVTQGKMRMHVSVNPLGFDFWRDRNTGFQVGRMSGSVVMRCRLMSNMKWPIYLAPQVAATFIYRETENGALNRIGFRAGVTIGLSSEER
jgi:hypothetical protein